MYEISLFAKIIIGILALFGIVCKIYAVWIAVKHDQRKWFVALMLLNTFGILEIYYIFKKAGKSWTDVKEDFRDAWVRFK